MQLWAHRGGGKGPLENTMQGFELALAAGFDCVEFDVMLSADGVLFVHHDWLLGRVAQPSPETRVFKPVAENTSVASLPASQLDTYLAGGAPLLRFEALAKWLYTHGLQANVELKAATPAMANQLGQAVLNWLSAQTPAFRRYAKDQWVYSSFFHVTLLPLIGHRIAILYEMLDPQWIIRAEALHAEAIHLHYLTVGVEQAYRIHTSKRKVRVYTVNDADEVVRVQQIGVDAVFTDNLGLISC